jgi:three-Cys-motif partner protein
VPKVMPDEYIGREQTWLKHRVLREYVLQWAIKVGARVRSLWYVDTFAGPWEARDPELRDTSFHIGLQALSEAAAVWRSRKGAELQLGAIFVEENPAAFPKLQAHVMQRQGSFGRIHAFHGRFEQYVGEIERIIGDEPAFIFVDPTGWVGADMRLVARLARRRMRDVMVNVMSSFLVRQKDRQEIEEQMRTFFGLPDTLQAGLNEDQLAELYRDRLRKSGGLEHVADLLVMHPEMDREYFRLVVGGHSPAVLEVFRDVEARVAGAEAAEVRTEAKNRARSAKPQLSLLGQTAPPVDLSFVGLAERGRREARERVLRRLEGGPMRYGELWPEILEGAHITNRALSDVVNALGAEGRLDVEGMRPRQILIYDENILRKR